MSSKSKIIEKFSPFFHVTSLRYWEVIKDEDIEPKDFGFGYSNQAPNKNPLICLTADHNKNKWLDTLCDKLETRQLVRIRIGAKSITKRDFDLDYTSNETEILLEKGADFYEVLKESGDVVCFGRISASEILNHEFIDCP